MAGPVKYRNIEIRGTIYADTKAVAQAFGISPRSVATAITQGRKDTIGLGRGARTPMPVEIRGTVYPSAQEAAKALGVGEKAIYQAIYRGTTDKVGLNLNRAVPINAHKARSKTFEIGGFYFPSQRAASRALGFDQEYVGRFLRGEVQNPTTAHQRIISAAMVLKAKQEQQQRKAAG